jgi:hypothetical protein
MDSLLLLPASAPFAAAAAPSPAEVEEEFFRLQTLLEVFLSAILPGYLIVVGARDALETQSVDSFRHASIFNNNNNKRQAGRPPSGKKRNQRVKSEESRGKKNEIYL